MNKAQIDGKKIGDGDYIIVDSEDREPKNGDVVLSVINGMANVKKFFRDRGNRQIVLVSESTHEFPPIYLHEKDDYILNGKVIQVVKKPQI
jgi:repressor LexA